MSLMRLLCGERCDCNCCYGSQERNLRCGTEYMYDYDPECKDNVKSTLPTLLPDVINCQSKEQAWHLPPIPGHASLSFLTIALLYGAVCG